MVPPSPTSPPPWGSVNVGVTENVGNVRVTVGSCVSTEDRQVSGTDFLPNSDPGPSRDLLAVTYRCCLVAVCRRRENR